MVMKSFLKRKGERKENLVYVTALITACIPRYLYSNINNKFMTFSPYKSLGKGADQKYYPT